MIYSQSHFVSQRVSQENICYLAFFSYHSAFFVNVEFVSLKMYFIIIIFRRASKRIASLSETQLGSYRTLHVLIQICTRKICPDNRYANTNRTTGTKNIDSLKHLAMKFFENENVKQKKIADSRSFI